MVKSGQTLGAAFVCRDATGALTPASVGPAGVLYVDGVVDAAVVTITGSNPYKWTVTLPTLLPGACVQVYITATVDSVLQGTFEFTDIGDSAAISDVQQLARFNSIASGNIAKLGPLGMEANLGAIAYGSGIFVGVGRNSALTPDEICLTSEDGLIWTRRTVPELSSASALYAGVCRTSTTFIAVGYNSDVAASSPDGITWTSRTLPSSTRWTSIAALGDLVCATAFNSGALAISSDHGATWTPQTLPVAPTSLSQIVANANVFCVAAYGASSCWTSSNGVAWTERPLGMGSQNWARAIAGTGTTLLLIPQGVAWGRLSTDNGATWQTVTLPQAADWNAACWTGSEWIIAAFSSNACATSSDGITWEASQLPLSSGWYGIATDGDLSVVISNGFGISGVATPTNYVGLLGLPNSNVNVVSVADDAQQDIADALDLAQTGQPRVTNLLLPGELEAAYTANKLVGDSAAAGYVAGTFASYGLRASALHAVGDELYIGICNNPANANGAVIMRRDSAGTLHFEIALAEQGVLSITDNAGKIYIVGLDRTSSGAPYVGNVYVRSTAGVWTKRSTVPHAEHIWCQKFIAGTWYIGTGTQTAGIFTGNLHCSSDDGATWTLVYAFTDWISVAAIGVIESTWYVIGTTATGYDGVKYSTDSGASWTTITATAAETGCFVRPEMPEFHGRLVLLTLGAIPSGYTLPLTSEGVLTIASDNTVTRYPFPASVLANDSNTYRFREIWTDVSNEVCYIDTASGIYYSRDLIVWTLLVGHDATDPIGDVCYWPSEDRFVMSTTGLLARLDLLRPVGVGDAELPPVLAGAVAAGIAAADYLANPVPGDYAGGTAGYVLGLISAGGAVTITPTNPVGDGGTITLYQGYDYSAIDSLAVDFLKSSPPDFTGATATLEVNGVVYAGSIVNPGTATQTLRFEFTAAQTTAMALGTYTYHVQVVKETRRLLRWTGPLNVQK